ncbi:hypothetical protein [Nonomuraea sp. B5E05]|uniref:hypothetical protein n=1 Tax=Nonomuraea sp. B5E05 TaxID=3153569 RepID=UPI0032610D39
MKREMISRAGRQHSDSITTLEGRHGTTMQLGHEQGASHPLAVRSLLIIRAHKADPANRDKGDSLDRHCAHHRHDLRTVHDVLVTRDGTPLSDIPAGSVIGTSSVRRRAQLHMYRPDLRSERIRGNVNSRLDKLLIARLQPRARSGRPARSSRACRRAPPRTHHRPDLRAGLRHDQRRLLQSASEPRRHHDRTAQRAAGFPPSAVTGRRR